MKRLHITWTFEFGDDEPEPDEPQPQGDVFTATERRASEDHETPRIGFGRSD